MFPELIGGISAYAGAATANMAYSATAKPAGRFTYFFAEDDGQ